MKKLKFNVWLSLLMLIIATAACQKNDVVKQESRPPTHLSVNEAEIWFNENINFLSIKSTDGDTLGFNEDYIPEWDNASISEDEECEVVETPLKVKSTMYFTLGENRSAFEATGNADYVRSLQRIVIKRDKKTGETIGFKMNIIGNINYLIKHNFNLNTNTYLRKDKDFNGMVIFHALDGTPANGWVFENGKATNNLKNKKTNKKKSGGIELKDAQVCFQIYVYIEACTDWYVNGNYSSTTCRYYWEAYEQPYCYGGEQGDGRDGGGGGGGGYTPPPDDPEPKPKDPKTPCGASEAIKADNSFQNKMVDYVNKSKSETDKIEYGHLKREDGTYQEPKTLKEGSISYGKGAITGKYTERIHTHPWALGGAPGFSPQDIAALYEMYSKGQMVDPLTFRYGIATPNGCYLLKIDDVNKFNEFGTKYDLANTVQKLKEEMYNTEKGGISIRGSATELMQAFYNFMTNKDSGISLIEGKIDDALSVNIKTIDWEAKELVGGKMQDADCNN